MSFINEFIPKEDLERYRFAELNKRPRRAGTRPATDWTIDREADVWLRNFCTEFDHTQPDGGFTGVSTWDFYWKGDLLSLDIELLSVGGGRGEHCWSKKKLLRIEIPRELENHRSEILIDLEAALVAYKDGGVLSSSKSYSLDFEI